MKKITGLINHYGTDSFLHCFFAMIIVLYGGYWGDLGLGIAWMILIALVVLKEVLDAREEGNEFSAKDVTWGISGGIIATIMYVLTLL